MRTTQPLLRSGLTVAAVAALPLALTAGPAAAATGISVSTSGSTVSVTTTACSRTATNGGWGTASLLTSSQTSFNQGRQVALSGTTSLQSAAWSSVSPGTYTVIVKCAYDPTQGGTQSIIVSASASPTISATASPSRGVMGGLGGATKDFGTLTLAAGGGLVAVGAAATAWFLRRRSRPYRL
ncbi:hypothetical protein [Streptomyces sp. SID13726]|uniref:hypothetical protein n=1 Tax=Streptomyces sp. SID13726 TaxID=2706058 RepID=UPI0013BA5174|nr:hypothetical protein [Streptomyces sp. SID13726]NEA98438.1 hypothetical protein [Streptomyces sp. SID13726]